MLVVLDTAHGLARADRLDFNSVRQHDLAFRPHRPMLIAEQLDEAVVVCQFLLHCGETLARHAICVADKDREHNLAEQTGQDHIFFD